jgi:cold shock CspA family protein
VERQVSVQTTPTIAFRGISSSPALEADIRDRIAKLETYCDSLVSCRVMVELAEGRHKHGNHYHVRIDLTVPEEEIVVTHDAGLHGSARDIGSAKQTKEGEPDPKRQRASVAIRLAFDTARRRLQDFKRKQRGAVKTPTRQPRGRIARLFPVEGYGYIEAEDGHEVYFQKSSVLRDAFERLTVDNVVAFVEQRGLKGPQASTVKLLHPRHRRAVATKHTVH